jgi:hypothetical protein
MAEISNSKLIKDIIPQADASYLEITNFAHTFDGYRYWDSFNKCGDIANKHLEEYSKTKKLSDDLTILRTSLFFEVRRWRHYGCTPDEEELEYLRAIIVAIREKVA